MPKDVTKFIQESVRKTVIYTNKVLQVKEVTVLHQQPVGDFNRKFITDLRSCAQCLLCW